MEAPCEQGVFVYLFCSDVFPIPRPVLNTQAVASGGLEWMNAFFNYESWQRAKSPTGNPHH